MILGRILDFVKRSYILRRLLSIVPQLFGITLVVFVMIRLIPGDPAYLFAGPTATEGQIAEMRQAMGLNDPIWAQYLDYVRALFRGDLGHSLVTSRPVATDILVRFPATFELITLALVMCIAIAFPTATIAGRRPNGLIDRITRAYAQLAGSLPDFWWGLILILIFFTVLGVSAAPLGRLDIGVPPPPRLTGMYTFDALVAGQFATFVNAVGHLILPATTLAFVYGGPIAKQARTGILEVIHSPYLAYARMAGLRESVMFRYTIRNAALPPATMAGLTYAYLIGAAVVVETVFSWGGLGQYAVQAITSSDYQAVSGIVLATTTYSLLVYLLLDFVYMLIDPRIRYA